MNKWVICILLSINLAHISQIVYADELYNDQVIGMWFAKVRVNENLFQSFDRYEKDGSYRSALTITSDSSQKQIDVKGRWSINGNKIELVVTESSAPGIFKSGQSWADTIVHLDANTLKLKDEQGGRETVFMKIDH